jgi:hypothetical protein
MKSWQKRLLPPVRVKPDARERLLKYFNDLPVRDDLRFWIRIEVDALIERVKLEITATRPIEDSDWNAEARESLQKLGNASEKN